MGGKKHFLNTESTWDLSGHDDSMGGKCHLGLTITSHDACMKVIEETTNKLITVAGSLPHTLLATT